MKIRSGVTGAHVLIAVVLLKVLSFAGALPATETPFTPKAYFRRYWKNHIRSINSQEPSPFLLRKCSPMNPVESSVFTKLAGENALPSRFHSFCSSANLFCFPEMQQDSKTQRPDANFANYAKRNFSNFGTRRIRGVDSFKKYSVEENLSVDRFSLYGRDSGDHNEGFDGYGTDGNVVDQGFKSYSTGAKGGNGRFVNYQSGVNVPDLQFQSYSASADGRRNFFSKYTDQTNAGDESFVSYRRNGHGVDDAFVNYAVGSNTVGSKFNNYAERSKEGTESFSNYGVDGNVPTNGFNNYASGGNGASLLFSGYRDQANVGGDTFQSYAKGSSGLRINFTSYGHTFNPGSTTFVSYAKDAKGQSINFRSYSASNNNNSFKQYANTGISIEKTVSSSESAESASRDHRLNRWIEPGKFFRESDLKNGNLMPMPDITDKLPPRSFLPRAITSKLPFSTSKLDELKRIFLAGEGSKMEKMISAALRECERPSSPGETKRCVGSAEDMVDFVVSVLGRDVAVRTTENVNGSNRDIIIGSIRRIDGGRITQSVSCHQSMFPYLVYYCHSVPRVRVYEADLFDPKTKNKINHAVAICHLDTSSWSSNHGAFLALGPGPGKIEVCHWIFENDMTWTVSS